MSYLFLFIGGLGVAVIVLLYIVQNLKNKIEKLEKTIEQEEEKSAKILSQKKSSEVRLGFIAEKLAPFLEDFHFDPEKLIFLGNPIDYIHYGDVVNFIEVKSGNSRLSAKQRKIKKLILDKKVEWYLHKVK